MDRHGFSLLVFGFTGDRALKFKEEFLNAFAKMEGMLMSDDYIIDCVNGRLSRGLTLKV